MNLTNDYSDLFGGDIQTPLRDATQLQEDISAYRGTTRKNQDTAQLREVYEMDKSNPMSVASRYPTFSQYMAATTGGAPAPQQVTSTVGRTPMQAPATRTGRTGYRSSGGGRTGYTSSGRSQEFYADLEKFLGDLETEAPKMTAAPQFKMPEVDESRADYYADKAARIPRSKMQSGVRRAMARADAADNPNVAKMITRSTMEGYGEGLGDIMGAAEREGLNRYMATEYNPAVTEAQANFQSSMQGWQQQNQRQWQDYMADKSLFNQLSPELFGRRSAMNVGSSGGQNYYQAPGRAPIRMDNHIRY